MHPGGIVRPRLEACWPVNKAEAQAVAVELQVTECLLAGSIHHVPVVHRAPQLADDEELWCALPAP